MSLVRRTMPFFTIRMKTSPKIVVGNWKMNVASCADAKKLVADIKKKTAKVKKTDIIFCPSAVYLSDLKKSTSKKIFLGAQNISSEEVGSYTGEISAQQIKNAGAAFSIIGHSERRKPKQHTGGETDEEVNKKVLAALRNKISPILCVGEDVHDEEGKYLEVVRTQLAKDLAGVSKSQISDCVIAYEPVWAIGSTTPMNSRDIHEMNLYIKKCLRDMFGSYATHVPVLYGGAVSVLTIEDIMKEGHVDGVLVGRDSLDAESFAEIVKMADGIK